MRAPEDVEGTHDLCIRWDNVSLTRAEYTGLYFQVFPKVSSEMPEVQTHTCKKG